MYRNMCKLRNEKIYLHFCMDCPFLFRKTQIRVFPLPLYVYLQGKTATFMLSPTSFVVELTTDWRYNPIGKYSEHLKFEFWL